MATPLQTARLRGTIENLMVSLSETLYKPLSNWNYAAHGYDTVVANGIVTYVLVTPVNDPPFITLANATINAKEGEDTLITGISVWDYDVGDHCDNSHRRWWYVRGDTLYPEHDIIFDNSSSSFTSNATNAAAATADNVELEVEVEEGSIYLKHITGLEIISERPYGRKIISRGSICNVREALSHMYYNPLSMSGGSSTMDNRYTTQDTLFIKVTDAMGLSDNASIHIDVELIDMPPMIYFLTMERVFTSGEQVLHVTGTSSGVDGGYPVSNLIVTTISRQAQAILSVTVFTSNGNPRLKIAGPTQGLHIEQRSGYLSVIGFPQDVNDALTTLHWYPSRMITGQGVVLDSVASTELRITAEISSDAGLHSRTLMIYSDAETLNTTLIRTPSESIVITSDSVCIPLEGISFEGAEWEMVPNNEVLPSPFIVSARADRGFMCQSYLVLDNFEEVVQALQQSLQYTPPLHYVGEDQVHIAVVCPGSGMPIEGSASITVKTDAVKTMMKPKLGGNLLPELQGKPLQLSEDSDLFFGPEGIILSPNEEVQLHGAAVTINLAAYNGNVTFGSRPIHTWITDTVNVTLIEGRMIELEGNILEGLNSCLERVIYRPP